MRIHSEAFWLPKAGNTEEEYEDAFWPPDPADANQAALSFAVADGATEASFSASWAQLLVRAYCEGRFDEGLLDGTLTDLQAEWIESVGSRPLPWYAEEKLRSGAFSSLLGVTLRDDSSKGAEGSSVRWKATAVGDSCLFHVRNDELITAFPLNHSQAFNSRPILISSRSNCNEHLSSHILECEGTLEIDDNLYLMTDALACWFLAACERGEKPWKIKRWLQFEKWVNRLRRKKRIRNDDVTIMRIERWLDKEED